MGKNERGIEYYTLPFRDLHINLDKKLRTALHNTAPTIRARYIAANPLGQNNTETVYKWMRDYTVELEKHLRDIVSRHSIFFWIHLYRRIAPVVTPTTGRKRDPTTAILVRTIGETAIQKFGGFDESDMKLSNVVAETKIMGGHFIRSISKHFGKKKAKEVVESLKKQPQWVMFRFRTQDFIDIYRIEGISYEYWRATAALRAIGKGAQIKIAEMDWSYIDDKDIGWLIDSYDERIERHPFDSTLLGTWSFQIPGEAAKAEHLVMIQYNAWREKIGNELERLFEEKADLDTRQWMPNFQIGMLDVQKFYDSMAFLEAPFEESYGISLRNLFHVCAILGELLVPESLNDPSERSFWRGMFNLHNRGYRTYDLADDTLASLVAANVADTFVELRSKDEVQKYLAFLSLEKSKQGKIALWTGGPRFLIVPHARCSIVDFQGITTFLNTITVGMPQQLPEKGSVFEGAVRKHFVDHGFEVRSGRIETRTGVVRDVDALVVVKDVALVCECCAIFRPLNYEIGDLDTFRIRKDRLTAKLEQNASLVALLREESVGRNYDLSEVREFVGIVVSPFVEWLWARDETLWIDEVSPRVMSVHEVLDYAKKIRSAPEPISA